MQTDMLKIAFMNGIRAASIMTDCMINLLPQESRLMAKSAKTSLLKMVHEISGDMLENEEHSEEAGEQKRKNIIIE